MALRAQTKAFVELRYEYDEFLTRQFHVLMRRGNAEELVAWLCLNGGNIVIGEYGADGKFTDNTAFFMSLPFDELRFKGKDDDVDLHRVKISGDPTNMLKKIDESGKVFSTVSWDGWKSDVVFKRPKGA